MSTLYEKTIYAYNSAITVFFKSWRQKSYNSKNLKSRWPLSPRSSKPARLKLVNGSRRPSLHWQDLKALLMTSSGNLRQNKLKWFSNRNKLQNWRRLFVKWKNNMRRTKRIKKNKEIKRKRRKSPKLKKMSQKYWWLMYLKLWQNQTHVWSVIERMRKLKCQSQ